MSNGLGLYGNAIVHREQNDFDRKARQSLNGEKQTEFSGVDDILENGSAEEIRKAFDKAAQSDAEKADAARSQRDGDCFVELHPDWLDTAANARQLRAHCMAAYGTAHPTLDQMEAAFEALKANRLVTLNQNGLAKMASEEVKARATKIKAEAFDPADDYNGLSLDEIRRRANGGL